MKVTSLTTPVKTKPSNGACSAAQDRIEVEMDPEIGALLLPGMTVTGHFSALSDGSWCADRPDSCPDRLLIR